MGKATKYSAEDRERAVRLVMEHGPRQPCYFRSRLSHYLADLKCADQVTPRSPGHELRQRAPGCSRARNGIEPLQARRRRQVQAHRLREGECQ